MLRSKVLMNKTELIFLHSPYLLFMLYANMHSRDLSRCRFHIQSKHVCYYYYYLSLPFDNVYKQTNNTIIYILIGDRVEVRGITVYQLHIGHIFKRHDGTEPFPLLIDRAICVYEIFCAATIESAFRYFVPYFPACLAVYCIKQRRYEERHC